MKKLVRGSILGLGFIALAGCSSSANDANDEDAPSAVDERLLAGGVDDVSNIAFDDAANGTEAFATDTAQPHVMAATGSRVLPSLDVAFNGDDAEDVPDTGSAADEATPESAATVTPDSTLGLPPQNLPHMTFHGGHVLTREHVYFIYYGNWANTTRTRSLLHTFVNGLHYNDMNHDFFDGLHYEGAGKQLAASAGVSFGGAYSVAYPYGRSLTDTDIIRVVHSVLASGRAPVDGNGLYFVMPSPDVSIANERTFCGWHNSTTMSIRFVDNSVVKQNIKYGVIRNARRGSGCSEYGTAAHHSATPNGDFVADSEVNVISHEMVETFTDPNLNAWFDATGAEDSDKCNFNFQDVRRVNGAYANVYDRRARHWWLIQSQYRHNRACGMGAAR